MFFLRPRRPHQVRRPRTPTGATPTPSADAEGDADGGPDGRHGRQRQHQGDRTTGGTDSAATPPPATQGLADQRHGPEQGSAPEQFGAFCEENAGAC